MPSYRAIGFFVLACVLLMAAPLRAQDIKSAGELVDWQVEAAPTTVAPDELVELTFTAKIDAGWKMYALDSPVARPVKVNFDALPPAFVREGELLQTEPTQEYDPNFQDDARFFKKEAQLFAVLAVAPDAAPGRYEISGNVTFMICNESMCLPPTKAPFAVVVTVAGEGAAEADVAPTPSGAASSGMAVPPEETPPRPLNFTDNKGSLTPTPSTEAPDEAGAPGESEGSLLSAGDDFGEAEARGFWGFLLLAVGAGLAALLTPCVFPMIPLTVSFFTKHADDRGHALRMAGVYGLAIVLTFTGLGVLMAVLVGAAGAQTIAANPWVNLFIGLVFVVFALSLLGLFELRLPSGLLNYFNRQSHQQGGYLGVLFMGLTLTLVSFSCTAPFVGGLLAATAGGAWSYPVLGMLVFSATFALPFVLFALFPKGIQALPRSGAWMNAVKVVLGFVELAAALKFFSNADLVWGWGLLSRPLAIALATVIFFLAGLYLLGKLPLKNEPAVERIGVGRLLAAIAFIGLSLFMLPGLFGAPLNALDAYLPPRQATDVSLLAAFSRDGGATAHDDAWYVDDVAAAFAEARAVGKPVLVDFTGYTCTNCREMEANVFTRPEVAERFRRDFVLLRLYTDDLDRGTEFQRYQLQLTGTVALPTYAIVSPQGEKLISKVSGIVSAPRFVAFLDRGAASYGEEKLAVR